MGGASGGGLGLLGSEPSRGKSLKAGERPHVALPAPVQSRACPWNCHYGFRLFQNPAADCSKGSQLLSGNSSGRSPLNTKKLRCNRPGWNSGKCWLWSLGKREHVSGQKEADLPAQPPAPSTCQARADPLPPTPPLRAGSGGLQPRVQRVLMAEPGTPPHADRNVL